MDATTRHLQLLPGLVAGVEVDLVAATHPSGGNSGKPTSRPPMPLAPVDDIELAWSALTTWARDWSETFDYTPPRPYWQPVCEFLARHWPRALAEHPAANEFATEVEEHHDQIRRHLGSHRQWRPLPGRWTCPVTTDDATSCFGVLLEHTGRRLIRCLADEDHTWEGELAYERLGRMLGVETTVTVDQAALFAKVHRNTILSWISSNTLPAVWDKGRYAIDKRDLVLIAVRKEASCSR